MSDALEHVRYSCGIAGEEVANYVDQLQAKIAELSILLRRAASQVTKWAEIYGEHDPEWLPPAGDVRLLEDISEALK